MSLVSKHKVIVTALIVLLGYLSIYYLYIWHDPLLERDDIILITPLLEVHSISKYFELLANGKIKDIQPIRDITFMVNLFFKNQFNIPTFHLTNILILFGIFSLIYKILIKLEIKIVYALVGITIFAFHPLWISGAGWVSARKHTLAILFLLFFILDIIKNRLVTKKGILYFSLSLLSHPISLLVPVWIFILRRIQYVKKLGLNFIIINALSLFIFFINFYKYYILKKGNLINTMTRTTFELISTAVLSFGRSIQLIFLPSHLSTEYYEGSIYNFIGIIILGLVILFYKKNGNRKDIIIWCSLFLCINATYAHYFINDTYLFMPLISQFILIMLILNKYQNHFLKISAAVIATFYLVITIRTAPMWLNNFSLWQKSFQNEQSPSAQLLFGYELARVNQELSYEFIWQALDNISFETRANALEMFYYTLTGLNQISFEKKMALSKKGYVPSQYPVHIYFGLLLLEGSEADRINGKDIIIQAMNTKEIAEHSIFIRFLERLNRYCSDKNEVNQKICSEIKAKTNVPQI